MASSPSLVKRTAFVKKYLKIAGTDHDIYSAILKKTSINTGAASGRDFMALFGEYCIKSTAQILTGGDYISHPQSPESLKIVVTNLLEDCKKRPIAGKINLFVPLCVNSEPGKPGHWSLATLVIENGLINSVEHADSAGKKPEIKHYDNLNTQDRDALEGFYYWFKDYASSMFAPDCVARQVLYAEQQGSDDFFSCLDRMIINLLRKRAWGIIGETAYNLCYGAYSGLDGAKRLRAITAQLLQNSNTQNSACQIKDISGTSLKSFIDSSLRKHNLPITGVLNLDQTSSSAPRALLTSLYSPLQGPPKCRTSSQSSSVVLMPHIGPARPVQHSPRRQTQGVPRSRPEKSVYKQLPQLLGGRA